MIQIKPFLLAGISGLFSVFSLTAQSSPEEVHVLQKQILNEGLMTQVDQMARQVASGGFNAGDGYGEVWIRDYNTFIELAMEVMPDEAIRSNLNTFFHFQGKTGDIVSPVGNGTSLCGTQEHRGNGSGGFVDPGYL